MIRKVNLVLFSIALRKFTNLSTEEDGKEDHLEYDNEEYDRKYCALAFDDGIPKLWRTFNANSC